MLRVGQELLEKIVEIVDRELSALDDANLLTKKPRQLETILKAMRDTASYRCRRELSGKEFRSPFDIIVAVHQIIARAELDTIANVRGVPIGALDTVQEVINARLRRELASIEAAVKFSQQAGLTDLAGAAVLDSLKQGDRVDVLEIVKRLSGEQAKEQEIKKFTSEDLAELQSLVADGKIYMFQAKNLAENLATFYRTGDGRGLIKALEQLTRR